MRIDVLTLFPEMIEQALSHSIPARAQKKAKVRITAHQLRQFAIDRHGTVDEAPYGGGPGMVMRVDVAHGALEEVDHNHQAYRVMLSPDGDQLDHVMVEALKERPHLVLLCGRYEGFDKRIEKYIDQKISIGPYVLSGGELPALVIVDAVSRLIPGVLGNLASLEEETFADGRIEYPQYTRPETYRGMRVPAVLMSGNHAEVAKWRSQMKRRTS